MTASTPIADHGLIGDLQTSALVTTDGVIYWFCAPRFDSPSLFASLLDDRNGGYFRIAPDGVEYTTKQLYLPGTAILITRFISPDGVGELIDFMPVTGRDVTDSHRIVRMLRVVRGSMHFVVDCQPRFDYARQPHKVEISESGVLFSHPADFTPVCTTELGRTAALKDEFDKRNTKAIAISVDPVDSHNDWANDIAEVGGTKLNFPIIGDPDHKVSELYDMIQPQASATATVRRRSAPARARRRRRARRPGPRRPRDRCRDPPA